MTRNVFDSLFLKEKIDQYNITKKSSSDTILWKDKEYQIRNDIPCKKRAAKSFYIGLQKKLKFSEYQFTKTKNILNEGQNYENGEKTSDALKNSKNYYSTPSLNLSSSSSLLSTSNKSKYFNEDKVLDDNKIHNFNKQFSYNAVQSNIVNLDLKYSLNKGSILKKIDEKELPPIKLDIKSISSQINIPNINNNYVAQNNCETTIADTYISPFNKNTFIENKILNKSVLDNLNSCSSHTENNILSEISDNLEFSLLNKNKLICDISLNIVNNVDIQKSYHNHCVTSSSILSSPLYSNASQTQILDCNLKNVNCVLLDSNCLNFSEISPNRELLNSDPNLETDSTKIDIEPLLNDSNNSSLDNSVDIFKCDKLTNFIDSTHLISKHNFNQNYHLNNLKKFCLNNAKLKNLLNLNLKKRKFLQSNKELIINKCQVNLFEKSAKIESYINGDRPIEEYSKKKFKSEMQINDLKDNFDSSYIEDKVNLINNNVFQELKDDFSSQKFISKESINTELKEKDYIINIQDTMSSSHFLDDIYYSYNDCGNINQDNEFKDSPMNINLEDEDKKNYNTLNNDFQLDNTNNLSILFDISNQEESNYNNIKIILGTTIVNNDGLLIFESGKQKNDAFHSLDFEKPSNFLCSYNNDLKLFDDSNKRLSISDSSYSKSISTEILTNIRSSANYSKVNKQEKLIKTYLRCCKLSKNRNSLRYYNKIQDETSSNISYKKIVENEINLAKKVEKISSKKDNKILDKLKKCLNVKSFNNINHTKRNNYYTRIYTKEDINLSPNINNYINDCPSLSIFNQSQPTFTKAPDLECFSKDVFNNMPHLIRITNDPNCNINIDESLNNKKLAKVLRSLESSAGYVAEAKIGNSHSDNLFNDSIKLTREERKLRDEMARITKLEVIKELKKIKKDDKVSNDIEKNTVKYQLTNMLQSKKKLNKKSLILTKIFKGQQTCVMDEEKMKIKPSLVKLHDIYVDSSVGTKKKRNMSTIQNLKSKFYFSNKLLRKNTKNKNITNISEPIVGSNKEKKHRLDAGGTIMKLASDESHKASGKQIKLSFLQLNYVKRCLTRREKNSFKCKMYTTSKILRPATRYKRLLHMTSLPQDVRKIWQSCHRASGETILHKASRLNLVNVISWVCANKLISTEIKDNAGFTPLLEACNNGCVEAVRCLLAYGANPNTPASLQQNGIRPLHEAICADNLDIVELLLSSGADLTLPTYTKKSIFDFVNSEEMQTYLNDCVDDFSNKDIPIKSFEANNGISLHQL